MLPNANEHLITGVNPQDFFQEALQEAISKHQLATCHETTLYLSNLLTVFVQAEQLFELTEEGVMLKPLAVMYADAISASTLNERDAALRRLGDVALFISGLFPQSLGRSLVDVDYYINMGGSAYGFLADSSRVSRSTKVFSTIFHELSDRFAEFVDVLAEVGDRTNLSNDRDVLRLYEIWLCSGSKNAENKLQKLGIQTVKVNRLTH
ncbi:MAG: hypothetical protein ACI9SC_001970 [Gammaproteobacteria bacterium]|jgi:hypothetical protein